MRTPTRLSHRRARPDWRLAALATAARTAVLTLAAAGCFTPATPEARVLEVAQEVKMATRFGHVEVALEHVAPAARESYVTRHAVWASDLRIVDVELVGLTVEDRAHADVELAVHWQANDEAVVRTTNVRQRFRDEGGAWLLESETHARGDAELFARVERAARRAREVSGPAAVGMRDEGTERASGPPSEARKNAPLRSFETRVIAAPEAY